MTTLLAPGFPAEAIWGRLDPTVPFRSDWTEFRHRQQGEFLHELAKYAAFDIGLSHIGTSDEGRVLHTLRFGRGPRRVLLWARQHGDEPDCSAGLAMALYELVLRHDDPVYAFILQRLELGVFPMVNPDGVARYTRRNAQGIDVNRDAVAQATAEGRAIMAIRESLRPQFCFNLHDMNPRKATADGQLVSIAFQAGPFEPQDVDNDVRLRAKQVIARMADVCSPHAEGHMARYTADYMHRAFGDSMMRLGVSSILIEAGGWHEDRGGDQFVRRLFALSLLRGLYAIATEEDASPSTTEYDRLPFDSGAHFTDLQLGGGEVINANGSLPFRADISVNVNWKVGRANEPVGVIGCIENIGDLADERTKRAVPIPGRIAMPGFIVVSPHPTFERDRPTAEEAARFIQAGITTVVTGFGPFSSNRSREQWMEAVTAAPPPINLIAFERVSSVREIRLRHGMTEFAGLLVQDLEISADDLLNFMHLFHPAHHSAIESDFAARTVGVDVLFQAGGSPQLTHLHLHLSPIRDRSGRTPVRPEELRSLVDEFLRSPSQITISSDPSEEPFHWLPFLIGLGGLSHGRIPSRSFFGEVLRRHHVADASGLVATLNSLTLTNARAFRLGNAGRIDVGQRADIAVFDRACVDSPELAGEAAPSLVLMNGKPIFDASRGTVEAGQGVWHFASAPQAR
jgi:hypothetical protein